MYFMNLWMSNLTVLIFILVKWLLDGIKISKLNALVIVTIFSCSCLAIFKLLFAKLHTCHVYFLHNCCGTYS